MSVPETITFDKNGEVSPGGARGFMQKFFLTILICLVAGLSFGLGRLSGQGRSTGVKIEYDATLGAAAAALPTTSTIAPSGQGSIVGSKNGSKYHYLTCSGAKQIKEENRIYFKTSQAAEAAGYTLAANCKVP